MQAARWFRKLTNSVDINKCLLRQSTRCFRAPASYMPILETSEFNKTEVTTLENGLRVASENMSSAGLAGNKSGLCSVGLFLDVGSRDEKDAEAGAAHMFEHLVYTSGSERFGSSEKLQKEIAKRGIKLTCNTGREQTSFQAQCLQEDLPWTVELLSDLLLSPRIDKDQFEVQRRLALDQLEELETDYRLVLMDYLHASAFQGTPLGRPIVGDVDSIRERLMPEHLRHFVQHFYKAPRTVLSAAGVGLDHASVADLAKKHFGKMSANYDQDTIPERLTCRFTGSDLRDRDDAIPLAHVAFALQGPGLSSSDTIPLWLALMLDGSWDKTSGGGVYSASKLARSYFANGLCHKFENFFVGYHDTSLWGMYYVADRDQLMRVSELNQERFLHHCKYLTDFHLNRVKNALKNQLALQLDSSSSTCDVIGRHLLQFKRRIPLQEWVDRIDKIDANDTRDVLERYMWDKDPVMVGVGPIEAFPDYNRFTAGFRWIRI